MLVAGIKIIARILYYLYLAISLAFAFQRDSASGASMAFVVLLYAGLRTVALRKILPVRLHDS